MLLTGDWRRLRVSFSFACRLMMDVRARLRVWPLLGVGPVWISAWLILGLIRLMMPVCR